jgi:integrase/recombinase XerD
VCREIIKQKTQMKEVTTSIFINKHSLNTKGKCSISLRVTFDRKKKYYPIGISLSEADFEKAMGDRPRNEFKELALKIRSFEYKASEIIKGLHFFSFEAFEKHFYTNRGSRDSVSQAFSDYAQNLREEGRIGTAVSYECAQSSFNKFAPKIKFAEVNPELLRKYEKWMLSQDKSPTTVGIYMRSLRTIFNNIISDGLLTIDYYPFGRKKYEIPSSKNVKKALSIVDISKIYFFKPVEGSPAERARDYWIFMYLCNGINVKDFCLLRYENLKGDTLEFERAKTARTKRNIESIRIPVSDDAKRIIKQWGNKKVNEKTFIFPVLANELTPERERQLIQQLTQVINSHMKGIAQSLEIVNDVTTYAARHSFATILQRSGASTEFISEALGHSNVRTTQNYLAGFEDESKREINKALTAFKNITIE